ncbi:STAS domain-containing protein [Desulfovibrio sp. OttesenSCG-928-O18]|nr:STAS domain-containing protein [Desulfovibrio sp. OttesenSCG-928-O18]
MKPFVHKSVVGNFFDILQSEEQRAKPGATSLLLGGTKRQEALISIFSGDFTVETLPEFAASLEGLLTTPVQLVVLDLSLVRVFSANAVGVLVNFLAGVEGRGKRLILYRPSEAVRETLASCDLTLLFEVQQTEDELLLALPDQNI